MGWGAEGRSISFGFCNKKQSPLSITTHSGGFPKEYWGAGEKGKRSGSSHVFITQHLKGVVTRGLPWWLSGKESACQCRRNRFDPWFGKILHAAEQLSQCTKITEPTLWSLWAENAEAPALRTHALQQEKPPQWQAHVLQRSTALAHCN